MPTVAEPEAVREEKLESNDKEAELGRMMYMIIAYGDARNKINDQKPFYGVRVLSLEHVV